SKVTIIHRRDELRAQKIIQERAFNNPKIEFIWNHVPVEILGDDKVTGIRIKHTQTGEEQEVPCDGVFIYIGMDPLTDTVKDLGVLSEDGYALTDEQMRSKVEGIFFAGDVRQKNLRQIVTATSDGSLAAVAAQAYVEEL